MKIGFFRFPSGLLLAKPRLTKLQTCLYAIIDSECSCSPLKWILYDPKKLQRLAAAVVKSSVHEDSIERAVKRLSKQKWILKRRQLFDGRIVLTTPAYRPGHRRRSLFAFHVPTEAMANPKLSYTAKLAFGALCDELEGSETTKISNKKLVEKIYVRKRSLDSAIPLLHKQNYIIIRNPKTRWREIRLHSGWESLHAEHKEYYELIRSRNRRM
jgi:hypothetical protein